MDCSFAPSGRFFVFDTDTGETLEKDFGSKAGAVAWMGEVSAAMRGGQTQAQAVETVRAAVAARREARRHQQRDRRPPQGRKPFPQRRAA